MKHRKREFGVRGEIHCLWKSPRCMNPFPATFGSDGFEFEQLRREGDIAIIVKQKDAV
jgi:hypothetical protein